MTVQFNGLAHCGARPDAEPRVFCEMEVGHLGPHHSTAHAWDADGTNYRQDWTLGLEEARRNLGWQYSPERG